MINFSRWVGGSPAVHLCGGGFDSAVRGFAEITVLLSRQQKIL